MCHVLVLPFLRFKDAEYDENGGNDTNDTQRVDDDCCDEHGKHEFRNPPKLNLSLLHHFLATCCHLSSLKSRLLLKHSEVTVLWQKWDSILLHLDQLVAPFASLSLSTLQKIIENSTWSIHGTECATLKLIQRRAPVCIGSSTIYVFSFGPARAICLNEIRNSFGLILEHSRNLVINTLFIDW